MKTLSILWLMMLIHISTSDDDDDSKPKNVLRIADIKIHGESPYMEASTKIHEDRKHFDIYVKLNRPLGSNYLIMNASLRGRIAGTKSFRRMLEMKRVDLCEFLTEYKENSMMRYFFKKAMVLSDVMVCPFRVSNYSVVNISVADNLYPQSLLKGTYRFYVEVVEPNGESPKLFAMQVTTEINTLK